MQYYVTFVVGRIGVVQKILVHVGDEQPPLVIAFWMLHGCNVFTMAIILQSILPQPPLVKKLYPMLWARSDYNGIWKDRVHAVAVRFSRDRQSILCQQCVARCL